MGVPRGAGNGQAATMAIVSGLEALTGLYSETDGEITRGGVRTNGPRKEDTMVPSRGAPRGALRKPYLYLHLIRVP